ncbi:hypothetical protein EXIGLDRAFT_13843 [Exidia glandulosa HHB12029]|uniref:PIN domain-containing protein n=1 Tax=Exidia glandulosa HHB12029 TaxID=1314781 RepID=A0A165QU91_EXIGL|nr:hypothetical protein EXIGLDRAFT_13843 [Exidia glandulosa HHB12029]
MALTRAAGLALGDAMDVVQEWNHLTESMEIDEVMDTKAEKRYLALDTNVLISALPLLKEFASFVEEHQLGVEFLIAGVVVEELDHLKKSGVGRIDGVTGQDLGLAARTASNWLLAGLRRRSQFGAGLIRGQAYHETRQSSANWKTRVNNESNDEVILDCCLHFSSSRKVYLFTMDKNFCNASLMNDIPIILTLCMGRFTYPHDNSPSNKRRTNNLKCTMCTPTSRWLSTMRAQDMLPRHHRQNIPWMSRTWRCAL